MTAPLFNDEESLASLQHKLDLIRDRTHGVAEGYTNGFFLWGEGGTSKSFTVEATLRQLGKPFKLTNSRLTAKGLFELLRDFPDAVHVLEDAEPLFSEKNSLGVLCSALWGQTGEDGLQERLMVWQTARGREEFIFTGGLIIVANCPLENRPEVRAIRTRIPCVHFNPTNAEVAALMRKIAVQGHKHGPYWLPPDECLEVAEEIITRLQRLGKNLDLRLLVTCCQDRLQWSNGAAETHWRQLLDSRMKERVLPPPTNNQSRSERKEQELAVVRRIAHLPRNERLETWKRETGKSEPALYRRLKELNLDVSHFLTIQETQTNNENGFPPPIPRGPRCIQLTAIDQRGQSA